MTKVVGYWRPLANSDATAPDAALKAAGATSIIVEAAADDRTTPALQQTLSSLEAGDVLLVERAAHIAVNLGKFVGIVADLGKRGIHFRSLAEPALSSDSPTSTADLLDALEALRRELIGIRTRAGLVVAANVGRKPGRPTVMTEERLAIAKELLTQGRTVTHVARVIGVSPGAVRRAIPTATAAQR